MNTPLPSNAVRGRASAWIMLLLATGLAVCVQTAEAAIAFRAASWTGVWQPTISYRASGAVASAASGNITPALASVELNALLICLVEQHDNVAISFPAGWNQLYSLSTTATHRASAFFKVAGSTEPNPLITHAGGNGIVAQCSTFRGVDAANPLDVAYAAQYAASSATVTSGSLTTVSANDIMLYALHAAGSSALSVGPSGTGGVTWTQRFYGSTALGLGATTGLYTGTKAAAGVVGPISATILTAAENNGVLMAVHDGSRLSIAVPAGTAAGDVMIAAIATNPSSVPITAPAGWTLIQAVTQATTTSNRLSTYYRVATAGEPAAYTWTLSTAHTGAAGGIVSYAGVDNTAPVDVSAGTATPKATSHTAPSVTATAAGDMLVTVHEYASASSWTPPAGMTERVDIASRSANTSGITLEMNELQLAATGATATETATAASSADTGGTVSIALRPAQILPHHIEIDHPGTGCVNIGNGVTVKACGDVGCTAGALITTGVNVTLSPGGNVVATGSTGVGTGTVTSATAGTVTLGASSLPAALNPTTCFNTVTGVFGCSYTFQTAGFTIAVPNGVSGSNVTGTITSCAAPFSGAKTINFYTGYNNPASGTKQASINATPVATSAPGTAISLTFNASSQASFTLTYPDVGQVTLDAGYTGPPVLSGASSFIMRPAGFVLSQIQQTALPNTANPGAASASGAKFVKAGEPFSITVKAVNSAGALTPNFGQESQPEDVKVTSSLVTGLGLVNNPALNKLTATTQATAAGSTSIAVASSAGYAAGDRIHVAGAGTGGADLITTVTAVPSATSLALAAATGTAVPSGTAVYYTFSAFSGGVATGTDFMWDEVGIITIMPSVADGSYLATANVVGDLSGLPSGNVGRFYLGKLAELSAPQDDRGDLCQGGVLVADGVTPCSSAFTYLGEEVDANFTLVAMSLNNKPLRNYIGQNGANDFAKLDPTVFANLNLAAVDRATPGQPYYLTARVSNAGMPLATCTTVPCFVDAGTQAQAVVSAPFMISRNPTPDGAYTAVDFGIAPLDADGSPVDATATGNSACNNPGVAACYDLDTDAVAGNDHAKVGTTQFRYGLFNVGSGAGSVLLPLPVAVTAQYWNGGYLTNTDDSLTTFPIAAVSLSNWQQNLTAGSTSVTAPAGTASIVNGIVTLTLGAPGAGKNGSVDIKITSPAYLLNSNPAREAFGLYKGSNNFIYQRESY